MSRRANNWLLIGSTGSGKSFYLNALLAEYKRKCCYLVIVNSSEELSQHCNHREYMSMDRLDRKYSFEKIKELIAHHQSVFFEVASSEGHAFLETLGDAVMALGKYNASQTEVLVVLDESRLYVGKNRSPKSFKRIEFEGRKYGIDIIKATQRMNAIGVDAIDQSAYSQVTRIVLFPLSEPNQIKHLQANFAGLPSPASLAFPDPETETPGEYIVWDRLRGRGARIARVGRQRSIEYLGGRP